MTNDGQGSANCVTGDASTLFLAPAHKTRLGNKGAMARICRLILTAKMLDENA